MILTDTASPWLGKIGILSPAVIEAFVTLLELC